MICNQRITVELILTAVGTCATGIAKRGASTGESLRCTVPSWHRQTACWTSSQRYHIVSWSRVGRDILCHPPYSSDLVPSDYHLFYSLDNHIYWKFFPNAADLCQEFTLRPKSPRYFVRRLHWIHFSRSWWISMAITSKTNSGLHFL